MSNTKELNIEKIIKKAVKEGLDAGLTTGYAIKQQEIKSYYSQAERRLYAYKSLKDGIKNFKEEIKELQREGLPEKSKSVVFMPSGSRLSGDDLLAARILDLEYRIQSNKREIKNIENAVEMIKDDEYIDVIRYKYFDGKKDTEISEKLNCDESTVRRNKKRLVNRLVIIFYGAVALN